MFPPDKALQLHEGECPAAALQIPGPQLWSVEKVSLTRSLATGGQDTRRDGGHWGQHQGGALHRLGEPEVGHQDGDQDHHPGRGDGGVRLPEQRQVQDDLQEQQAAAAAELQHEQGEADASGGRLRRGGQGPLPRDHAEVTLHAGGRSACVQGSVSALAWLQHPSQRHGAHSRGEGGRQSQRSEKTRKPSFNIFQEDDYRESSTAPQQGYAVVVAIDFGQETFG